MEGAEDRRNRPTCPRQEHLQDQEPEDAECVEDARTPDSGGESEDECQQAAEQDEVAEAGVEPEAVLERLLVDRPVGDLVGGVERAVARKADLQHDRRNHQHHPPTEKRAHPIVSVRSLDGLTVR